VAATLRAAWPHARIDWLVQDSFADVVRGHPAVSGVVLYPRSRFRGPAGVARFLAWLPMLRTPGYDLVIDAQGLARSGAMALATRAPRRVGHADAREGAPLAYTDRAPPGDAVHTVDRMLTLTRALGLDPVIDLSLRCPAADAAGEAAVPPPARPYAVIAPTSRWPAKRWPAERFAAVARELLGSGRVEAVAVVGGAGEREQCEPALELAEGDRRVVDLVGRTTVADLMRLIEGAAIVIANDSAALHIAVGFDRPIVGLYGPTRVDRVGPYRREADVIQKLAPGDDLSHKRAENVRMMERIEMSEVLEASLARFD
jgi:heptosyltransferase-1